jgi:NADPH:quinone reductase-like Zn-dependent oxidoreductase
MLATAARASLVDATPPLRQTDPSTMRAVVHYRYGIDSVELREVDRPEIADDQVLVRVHASSVNPVEWYGVTGMVAVRLTGGGIRRPKDPTIGADVAGRVEAVGKDVTAFQVGDEVFGSSGSAWAEYAPAREHRLARKPANVSFEEAGCVAVAAMTALQAVRDHGRVQPGQKVLVNGAAGGVGSFAVQIAKAFGAEVTAVCSTQNVEQTLALGADRVVDYTREDFTKLREKHDVMLDVVGSRSFLAFRRVLTPDARVVAIGAPMSSKGIGPLKHIIGTRLLALGRSQTIVNFVAKINSDDLAIMGELMAAGKVRAVIDRRYDLSQAADALRYLGTTHARGKIAIRP